MLTPKQEGFAQAYVETGNASEAYKLNYKSDGMKPESVNREAKAQLDHPKIASRINELRAEHAKRHEITVDDLIRELEEARMAALTAQTVQASAAANATMGKARLLGLDKQLGDADRPIHLVGKIELVPMSGKHGK